MQADLQILNAVNIRMCADHEATDTNAQHFSTVRLDLLQHHMCVLSQTVSHRPVIAGVWVQPLADQFPLAEVPPPVRQFLLSFCSINPTHTLIYLPQKVHNFSS